MSRRIRAIPDSLITRGRRLDAARALRVLTAVLVCGSLTLRPALGGPVAAQSGVRIVVVAGDGVTNVTQQIPSSPMTVRVEDAAGGPVVGANVTFTAPPTGPGGVFENDSNTVGVITGLDGLASAGLYHPNAVEGSYRIQVRAEFQGQSATAIIEQSNDGPGGGHGRVIAVLAIVGAAVGAAFAAGFGGGSSTSGGSSTNQPPQITFGGGAVGAPAQ